MTTKNCRNLYTYCSDTFFFLCSVLSNIRFDHDKCKSIPCLIHRRKTQTAKTDKQKYKKAKIRLFLSGHKKMFEFFFYNGTCSSLIKRSICSLIIFSILLALYRPLRTLKNNNNNSDHFSAPV